VEIRETVKEIFVPAYKEVVEHVSAKPRLFEHVADEELLSYGVPPEWLRDVREADEDSLLSLADHLPSEAAEALLELATGGKPQFAPAVPAAVDPFEHPDAQRRFRVMNNVEELAAALDYPWDKWTIFLHPAQRELVECDFNGPARVAGSAGTGKTIVALHRAVYLARNNRESRVLLTTFSDTLANALRYKLRRLLHHEPRLGENIEVHSITAIGRRLYELKFAAPKIASDELIRSLLAEAAKETPGHKFTRHFLWTEWSEVADAWQLDTWEAYRDVLRLGRKTRLSEQQRAILWSIFDRVRSRLQADGSITYAAMFGRLATELAAGKRMPFDFVVVDEAQDVSVAQLRFLAALGTGKANSLFFAGDLGQRIFQQPFSWKALGVDIRGRSRTLHINYRTSHQIRTQADRLLGPELSDVDGIAEERIGTISVFNGPVPTIRVLKTPEEESQFVINWLLDRAKGRRGAPRDRGVRSFACGTGPRS
jgi:AAA domain